MKKLSLVLLILVIVMMDHVYAQPTDKKNIAGIGVSYFPYMSKGIYFDSPFDFWPNNEPSAITRIFYARQMNESFRLGAYLESGSNRFTDQTNENAHSFNRSLLGLEWISEYPKTRLHLELGGYFGYGLIKASHWNDLHGVDFGMLAGPAFDMKYFGVSVNLKAGFSPYKSKGTPEGILLYTPGVLFKVYGKF
ncbi:MAG: hypothetical protein HXX13_06370 [Bacteroidetes bacterium]|nr:hypothetical protein [Bacteroidota bacterium]